MAVAVRARLGEVVTVTRGDGFFTVGRLSSWQIGDCPLACQWTGLLSVDVSMGPPRGRARRLAALASGRGGDLLKPEVLADDDVQLADALLVEAFAAPDDAATLVEQHQRRELVDGELRLDRAVGAVAAHEELVVDAQTLPHVVDL